MTDFRSARSVAEADADRVLSSESHTDMGLGQHRVTVLQQRAIPPVAYGASSGRRQITISVQHRHRFHRARGINEKLQRNPAGPGTRGYNGITELNGSCLNHGTVRFWGWGRPFRGARHGLWQGRGRVGWGGTFQMGRQR
jgi:hypothetical protein